MDDKGEKIVFLARELLNAGVLETAGPKARTNITMTFKTLCLTTLLAAAGGGLATAWMHENDRPLNRYEKTELQALLFYTARLKGIDEDTLRLDVEKQAGIDSFEDMTGAEFPAARRFLQEKAQ